MNSAHQGSAPRASAVARALSVLVLAACGDPPPDPTVSHSDAEMQILRERMRTVQASR